MNKKSNIQLLSILIIFGLISFSCGGGRSKGMDQSTAKTPAINIKESKISKAVFYFENSESMFGYVNGITEYVDVISELSEKPEFVAEKITREFYFINGGNQLKINSLGEDPAILKTKLNKSGYNCGDISKSNLNSMFQIALEKAQNDTISILISDAIYDIGQPTAPLNALLTEGRETRSKFITRLENGDLQTLLIKLNSKFDGNYFYSSHIGKTPINQKRPFYIWIFGKSELVNKYFSEDYISKHLKGYENYARFLILKENTVPYQISTSINPIGTFRLDHSIKNKIINAEAWHGEFQFSIGVDFSLLPFSESYLTTNENYVCSNQNFKISKVEKIKAIQKFGFINFPNPTHIITINTDKNPCGDLEILLKNDNPNWISLTDIDNENMIDSIHTFGFKFLTNAMSEAYSYKNKSKSLTTFKIVISNGNESSIFNWMIILPLLVLIVIGLIIYNNKKQ